MAARAQGNAGDAPDTRWCLGILERKGATGNGDAIAHLARFVGVHFDDEQERTQTFARFDGLARRLDQEQDPAGQSVRLSLAWIYRTMPDPVGAARLLIDSVAGQPADERAHLYRMLAGIGVPWLANLPREQHEELVSMLEPKAASLPDGMGDEIIGHLRRGRAAPAAGE